MGFGAYYFLVPSATLEDHVLVPTPLLRRLLRRRVVLAGVWAVALAAAIVFVDTTPQRDDTILGILVALAVVTFSAISLVLAGISIVRIRSELAARAVQARFPVQEE